MTGGRGASGAGPTGSMEPTRTPRLAPYLVVRDAGALIEFLERALDGRLAYVQRDPEGRVRHAEVRVADAVVMLADAPAGAPPFPAMVHLYVADADLSHRRALAAGAQSVRVPEDQPDGDRRGGVADPWGNQWWFTRLPPSGR